MTALPTPGPLALPVLKTLALALLLAGVGFSVFLASIDPKGAPRRLATAYAAGLDTQLRSLFLQPRGTQIAWLQATGAIALLAMYAFVPVPALAWGSLLVLVVPRVYLDRMVKRRRKKIDDQVNSFTLALANALKTTASIGDALRITVDVTAKPIRQELETALKQVRVGSTLDEALLSMSARASAPALDIVVSTLLIGRQMGGDLPRILEGVAGSLRELKRLEELTEKTTNSSKQSVGLAAAMVIALAVFLPRAIPGFFDPLRDTLKGQIIVLQCVIVFLLAIFLAYKFTRQNI